MQTYQIVPTNQFKKELKRAKKRMKKTIHLVSAAMMFTATALPIEIRHCVPRLVR